jgi:hypothetical protein
MNRLNLVLVSLIATGAWASPRLELEVGGGATAHAEPSPTFSARLGIDFIEHLTPSIRMLTLTPPGSEQQVWAMLGEFRVHSSGRFQVSAALGVGFGNAAFAAVDRRIDAEFFAVAPYVNADVGARLMLGRFWIGLNVGGMPWSNLWLATLNVGVGVFGGE